MLPRLVNAFGQYFERLMVFEAQLRVTTLLGAGTQVCRFARSKGCKCDTSGLAVAHVQGRARQGQVHAMEHDRLSVPWC